MNRNCGTMSRCRRHLGRQIWRALIAKPIRTTRELCIWAYGEARAFKGWQYRAVRRACRQWGFRVVGKRGRSLLWSM